MLMKIFRILFWGKILVNQVIHLNFDDVDVKN